MALPPALAIALDLELDLTFQVLPSKEEHARNMHARKDHGTRPLA
jgi:hypothetical protein